MTGKLVTTNSDYFYSLSEKGPGMVVSEDEFIGAIKTNDNIIAIHLMADPDDMSQIDKAGTLASEILKIRKNLKVILVMLDNSLKEKA